MMKVAKAAAETRPRTKAVRTTISLPAMVHSTAQEMQKADGFTSLSDLFEFLIRIHKGKNCG